MMTSARELIEIQEIDQNSYSGRCNIGRAHAVYGGQVIGQALMAAYRSIKDLDSDFLLNSFHCYFLSPTLHDEVLYQVRRVKEGRNLCSLTVDASQVNNRINFKCMMSFAKLKPGGNAFDLVPRQMPSVPHPDKPAQPINLDGQRLYDVNQYFKDMTIPGFNVFVVYNSSEIDRVRRNERPTEVKRTYWIKTNSGYSQEDDQNLHRIVLAYSSDIFVARCVECAFPKVETDLVTSLDHSLWFHSDCDSQQWHLYVTECDFSKAGRTLNSIRIYKEDGTLVASGRQDAICRPKL